LWRLKKRCEPFTDPRLVELARCAAAEFEISRSVDLKVSSEQSAPITWGSWQPVLLLPEGIEQWSDERCLAVLRHEFGHIARNDFLMRWLAHLTTALYWPNPFIWVAARHLRTLQEHACDDLVLTSGIDSNDYASLLVDTARSLRSNGLAARHAVAMARPSSLEERVVAIVDNDRVRGPAGRRAFVLAISMAGICLAGSALAQLKGQEQPTPPRPIPGLEAPKSGQGESPARTRLKANSIILPKIEFKEAEIREVIDYLRKQSVKHDPKKEGVSFVLKFDDADSLPKGKITLSLTDTPLLEAAKYVANLVGMKVRVEPYAIAIVPPSAGNTLISKEYKVPPEFLQKNTNGLNPNSALATYARGDFADLLKKSGVTFPEGASAVYVAATNRLIMRNTDDNQDLLEQLLTAESSSSPQAEIVHQHPIVGKLERMIIPRLELRESSARESLEFLERKTRDMDPDKTGVKFTIKAGDESMATRITISLRNIPMIEAIKYVTNLASLKYHVTNEEIVIESLGAPPGPLSFILKEYRLPENAVQGDGSIVGPDGVKYPGAREMLVTFGINFPEGTTAAITSGGKTLATRTTQDKLDQIDVVVAGLLDAKGGALPPKELELLQKTLQSFR
ncbi:MAG TPA: M56 family metallopeptidase, partial [Chthoniobacteraceae bacterium]|nr:M56 family metallopeptidase [Chthoniobacteraceae bacterium]